MDKRSSRREFLETASVLGVALPVWKLGAESPHGPSAKAPEATKTSSNAKPLFNGQNLDGWRAQGPGKWGVENAAIVGSGGWLVLQDGVEDFVLKFSFRGSGGEAGVLLRKAPVNWSRFSHPPNTSDRTAGIYVVLSGARAGELSHVTLDAEGRELERKVVPPAPLDLPGRAIELSAGTCAPIPCVGVNGAQGTPTGYPPEPPVRISSRPDGWQQADITLRGVALRWDNTGVSAVVNERSLFGQIALHVSASDVATFHFKDISIIDLTQRAAGLASGTDPGVRQLTDLFYSEGVTAGDLNRDGYDEIVAGPFYYIGPEYKVAREIYPPTTINVGGPGESGNYSNCFLAHVHDFTGDGWPDVLMIMGFGPMPNFSGHLFLNPHGERRHWDNYNVIPRVNAETTSLVDIDGDGRPELIMAQGDQIGYAKPDWSDVTKPWKFYPVSEPGSWGPHGFGFGDINGDGRLEIVQASGWWEQPAPGQSGPWTFHRAAFGATEGEWFLRGGADILVYDVNGDGLADVITSLNAHGPGLAWFEQQRDRGGSISWKRHIIMGDPATPLADRREWEETDKSVAFTELHALQLADVDGDGLPAIITGKRWWSHGYISDENDVENPPVLYRFKLNRKPGGSVEWVPKLIHSGSGVGTQILVKDINRDGRPEIMTTARKGTFLFFSERGNR